MENNKEKYNKGATMEKKDVALSLFSGILEHSPKAMKVISEEIEEIETKIIKYGHVSENLEVTSMDHISLPFFTRKRNRRVNLQYQFSDLGVTMYANLTSQKEKIKQPSEFEESIYEYVMQKCFEIYRLKINKIETDTSLTEKEKQLSVENIFSKITVDFSLDELLDFLGAGNSGSWRSKVDEAMENLKFVEYYFNVNNAKLANNSSFEFETRTFKLLNYEKIKVGKKKGYRVWPSSTMLFHSFQNKNYLYFTPESRKEIGKKSRSALRVFRYISKKRFSKEEDTSSLEALAIIVPYEIEIVRVKETKQGMKEYVEDRRKKAKELIESHMDVLVELGYLSDYQTHYIPEQKSYEFWYRFGEKMGIVTSYLIKNKNKKDRKIAEIKNIKSEEFYQEADLTEKVVKQVREAKRNIYISKAWNKRADNKIKKIFSEHGEDYTVFVLKAAYKNLKQEIKSTLVQYLNGIIKKVPMNEFEEEHKENKSVKATAKKEIVEAEIVEQKPKQLQEDPMSDLIYNMFLDMKEVKKQEIKEKAIQKYLKETGSKSLNSVHEKIFKSMEKSYIIRIIKGE
jgi:hypothetical protein